MTSDPLLERGARISRVWVGRLCGSARLAITFGASWNARVGAAGHKWSAPAAHSFLGEMR